MTDNLVPELERGFAQLEREGMTKLIRRDGEPYLHRGYIGGRGRHERRAYLHKFLASDAPTHHNHPFDVSTSIILAGAYREHLIDGTSKVYTPGMINSISRDTFHWLELLTPTVWTYFVPGDRVSRWGFIVDGEYVDHEEYKAR